MIHRAFRHATWLIALAALLIATAVFGSARIERSAALHAASQQQQAQRLLTAMLDQETAARGYFETRDLAFLGPWYSGTDAFADALRSARSTAAGDPQLLRNLDAQQAIAAGWHSQTAAAISLVSQGQLLPTRGEELARKAVMDSFRSANDRFSALISARRDTALTWATVTAVIVVVVLALAISFGGLLLVRRNARRASRRRRGESELRELLQVSSSESESRGLLIRHIERIVPGSGAAVLNRNSGEDLLEPCLGEDGERGLLQVIPREGLQPSSCLAVRLSRPYVRRAGEETLAQCGVCGKLPAHVQCEPLLVGGKVIGSVLVGRDGGISEFQHAQVRDAVAQAAPIIANQRNLALAELRAASDTLTGLPNRGAADHALKRMAAHSGRAVSPLSAVLIDLDHFKRINDMYGHEQGDEALAAVGQILGGSLRASDFAARFGGEEFLLLLPDTDRERARIVAEKLRLLIEDAEIGPAGLTASFGVASMPEDAVEADVLVRKADRALYLAKRTGRNRVALAASAASDLPAPPPPSSPPPSPPSSEPPHRGASGRDDSGRA